MKQKIYILSAILSLLFVVQSAFSHCQVPCGIYNDQMRIDMIEESITTIEKAMKKIDELSKADKINYNQLVRWINTKEEHANKIQQIVSEYFMTQKIKLPPFGDKEAETAYLTKLSLLHQLLVYSMKAKQSTDLSVVKKLTDVTESFEKAYFGPEHTHKEHH